MTGWILAVLALFVVQTLLPAVIRYYGGTGGFGQRISQALGPRDTPPPMPIQGERAQRALRNMFESLPVFLTLAVLLHVDGKATALAQTGAAIFLAARLLYVPTYVFGVYGIRSVLWGIGWIGLLAMAWALVS